MNQTSTNQVFDSEARIAIIGATPPPYGGVSVHIARLVEKLRDAGISYSIYDLNGVSRPHEQVFPARRSALWMAQFVGTCREGIVHFHTSFAEAWIYAAPLLRARGKQFIVTFHGESAMIWYRKAGLFLRALFRASLNSSTAAICVSKDIAEFMREIGIPESKIHVSPAFIPPSLQELSDAHITDDIRLFFASHRPIVGSHGTFGDYIDGEHIYSFEMLAKAFRRIKDDIPEIGFFTKISGTTDVNHRDAIMRQREELGLVDSWLILEHPFPAAALFAKADLFVRPTITDGDSVSIRECLAMGVPVVASDCVSRPTGCVLFSNRNLEELIITMRYSLQNLDSLRATCRKLEVQDGSRTLIGVYREIIGEMK